jgi:hypothetical protein
MICKRCKKELKKQGRHTSRSCLGVLSKTAPFSFPDPEDSWARIELWRWQYGTLPAADDMRPLDVSKGLIGLAAGLMNANPVNVAGVIRYCAKIIRQNPATTAEPDTANKPLAIV